MRDSVVFYRSFYEAITLIPEADFNQAVKNILEYAFNEVEPESKEGIAYALFCMAKPQIDANNQRFENGKKGGRPRKTNGFENEKPMVLENSEIKKPNVNVNDNVNVNVNENELINSVVMNTYYPIKPKKSKEDVLKELDQLSNK